MTGIILKGIAGFYYVQTAGGAVYECHAVGIFRNRNEKPLVGDRVEIEILDEEKKEGSLTSILPRKSQLVRPAVANVDQSLIVFALRNPEPNCNLLDRFLLLMQQQDIPTAICFNKADISGEQRKKYVEDLYAGSGCKIFYISTRTGEGLDEVKEWLKGKVTVLAGPSGVGKSSLLNILCPHAGMETGTLSEKIQRGKNTTRHSELFCVENESEPTYLFDTPGFSSLFLPECEPEELKELYPEFLPYEPQCRFLGCVHIGERECGVKDAVLEGKIPKLRYANYRSFYEEIKSSKKY